MSHLFFVKSAFSKLLLMLHTWLCLVVFIPEFVAYSVVTSPIFDETIWFLGHLLRDDLMNPVKMSGRPSVRPSLRTYVRAYVRTSTIKLNAATNQIVEFVRVDESLTMISLSRSSEVNQGHMRLSFKNDDFHILSLPPFFNQSKKFQRFLILDQNIENLLGWIFEFPPSYRVMWLQTLPKNRLRLILMKLGTMLEFDETFTTMWLSRSSEVRVACPCGRVG